MISIVICSRDKDALAQVSASVKETIGIPCEIIAVDNAKGKYGICEAYNIGASQAKYDALCFMHEDLRFHSTNWGKTVLSILARPEAGVVGVAGGTYQYKAPTSWISNPNDCLRTHVLHAVGKPFLRMDYCNPYSEELAEVATVDGLWMCCRKNVWQELPFDQKAFPHFHFYDIDFCTNVHRKYKNYVTFNIEIEHFSEGTFKIDWTINALRYFKIRQRYLPFGTVDTSPEEARRTELRLFQQTLKDLINYKAKAKYIAYCAYCCAQLDWLNKDTLWIIKQYLKDKTFYRIEQLG